MNTTNRDSCRHHFEHVKQTRPFTEREYMQCTKCGLQNPLGLFQHWDTERDGPAIKWPPRDNGGTGTGRNVKKVRSSGPHLQWVKNTTGKIEDIITREEWDKANPPLRPDSSYGANYAQRRYGSKRKHAITVRKLSGWYGNFWKFSCTPCGLSINYPTWETAYQAASHHAHNHHGEKR